MAGTVVADKWQNGDGTENYKCRAWVNFNGTVAGMNGTDATGIRASGNVSSITDNGVGIYTVNFTSPMPDTNYGINASFGSTTTAIGEIRIAGSNLVPPAPTTTQFPIHLSNSGATAAIDVAYICATVFR